MNNEAVKNTNPSRESADRQVYELIFAGLMDEEADKEELKEKLKQRFALKEEEAEKLIRGELNMPVMFRMQALHVARELNQMGILTQIRRKSE